MKAKFGTALLQRGFYVTDPRVYLFIKQNNKECERAKRIVEDAAVPFEIIDVEKNNIINCMWFDVGSFKAPILVTRDLIISGASYIKLYLQRAGDSV